MRARSQASHSNEKGEVVIRPFVYAFIAVVMLSFGAARVGAATTPFPAEGSCEYVALYKNAAAGSNGADSGTMPLMHILYDNGEADSYLFMNSH